MSTTPPSPESAAEATDASPPQASEDVSLQFFLGADGALGGAHTVGLAERTGFELLVPTSADAEHPGWTLTVGEVHDLLCSLATDLPAELLADASGTGSLKVPLDADDAVLSLTAGPATDAAEAGRDSLPAGTALRVLDWTVAPGPSPRPLPEGRAEELAGAVNGLRLSAGLLPVAEESLDFSPEADFSVATPMVHALGEAVLGMDAPRLGAWHVTWMGALEGGYRSDVALATAEALAVRTGRLGAWQALVAHADEVAKQVLGADGPSELLMETCAQLFEQVGVEEDDETRHLLLGRIAVMLHDQVRVLLLTALVEDVAGQEVTVPPLQAWWSGQSLAELAD